MYPKNAAATKITIAIAPPQIKIILKALVLEPARRDSFVIQVYLLFYPQKPLPEADECAFGKFH